MEAATLANLLGLALGLVYGFIANRSGFCFFASVRALVEHRPNRQLRSFVLAMITALVGTQILVSFGGLNNLHSSVYLATAPNLIIILIGSAVFSLGMVLANGCPNRHLVLLGEGNLRSLPVLLVLGVSAYMALKGLFAIPRIQLGEVTRLDIGARSLVEVLSGLGLPAAQLISVLILTLVLVVVLLRVGKLSRSNALQSLDGLVIGGCIAAAWYITGVAGFDEFDPQPPEALTFTVPVGDSLLYLMTFTGSTLGFITAVIGGVLAGSFMHALIGRKLQLRGYDGPGHMLRMLLGAMLMGVGGVTALGCTIGQGLSGFSTLALGSLVATAGIFVFSYWMLRRRKS